jgi:hypothetical protein
MESYDDRGLCVGRFKGSLCDHKARFHRYAGQGWMIGGVRNFGRWLAYISAFGRQHFGRYGRTSAHHPRLLAALEPQCNQPVLAGHIEHQAPRPGEARRCDRVERIAVCKQIKSSSVNSPKQRVCAGLRRSTTAFCVGLERLSDPNGPRSFKRGFCATD